MAKEEKPKPTAKTGHDVLWEILGFVVALLVLANALSSSSLFTSSTPGSKTDVSQYTTVSGVSSSGSSTQGIPQGDLGFWSSLARAMSGTSDVLSSGALSLGIKVIDRNLLQVRREPGGSVIGLQKKGEKGTITDGPVNAYGTRWFMVEYENIPSGWVDEKDITTQFFWYYVVNFFPMLWGYWKIISTILSVFFGLVILYAVIGNSKVPTYYPESEASEKEKKEEVPETLNTSIPAGLPVFAAQASEPRENEQWRHIELLMKSHNPNDWRQAVIEADVMLEDMLDHMGYVGAGVGEKLKNVEESDFKTLDKAWEAHKVRNRLAHDASGYKFSYDEATRIIGLFRDVFNEFYWG